MEQKGYDLEILEKVCDKVNIPVIASGGAGNLDHLYQALTKGKASAVLGINISLWCIFYKGSKRIFRV